MTELISFAVVSDTGGQEMIITFIPPLIVDDSAVSKLKASLSASLVKITGAEVAHTNLDSEAIALLEHSMAEEAEEPKPQIVKPPKPAADNTSITKSANRFKREN